MFICILNYVETEKNLQLKLKYVGIGQHGIEH